MGEFIDDSPRPPRRATPKRRGPPPAAISVIAVTALLALAAMFVLAGSLRAGGAPAPLAFVGALVAVVVPVAGFHRLPEDWRERVLLGGLAWIVLLLGVLGLVGPLALHEAALAAVRGAPVYSVAPGAPPPIPEAPPGAAPDVTRPAPDAAPPPAPRPPTAGTLELPFETDGSGVVVEVRVGHGAAIEGRRLLFDTGATITTLDTATLAAIGITVPADAPVVTTSTAAGEVQRQLVHIDRLWLGEEELRNVTIGVCDLCKDDDSVGLLGLNVWGRYQVTLDLPSRRLLLGPTDPRIASARNVGPWLNWGATRSRNEASDLLAFTVTSRADRPVGRVDLRVGCTPPIEGSVLSVPARGTAEGTVAVAPGTTCPAAPGVEMVDASW